MFFGCDKVKYYLLKFFFLYQNGQKFSTKSHMKLFSVCDVYLVKYFSPKTIVLWKMYGVDNMTIFFWMLWKPMLLIYAIQGYVQIACIRTWHILHFCSIEHRVYWFFQQIMLSTENTNTPYIKIATNQKVYQLITYVILSTCNFHHYVYKTCLQQIKTTIKTRNF